MKTTKLPLGRLKPTIKCDERTLAKSFKYLAAAMAKLGYGFMLLILQVNLSHAELLYFKAISEPDKVVLEWATGAEVNSDFFALQRSSDAIDFEDVKVVRGAGNSSAEVGYMAVDEKPVDEAIYYRLKQADKSGNIEYSELIMVQPYHMNFYHQVYPNPVKEKLFIRLAPDRTKSVTISVFDQYGKLHAKATKWGFQPGSGHLQVNMEDYQKGVYYVKIEDGVEVETHKLVKRQ